MDKKVLVDMVVEYLEKLLNALIDSAKEAKDAATNEESKAENKYDTRGLEASYLAGAQAERAGVLLRAIDTIRKMTILSFNDQKPIQSSAIVEVEMDGDEKRTFFFIPTQGGIRLELNGQVIQTISPESPIGKLLLNREVGDSFEMKTKDSSHEYEILSVK